MWLVTGVFSPSNQLQPHLKKFLSTRKRNPMAGDCLHRYSHFIYSSSLRQRRFYRNMFDSQFRVVITQIVVKFAYFADFSVPFVMATGNMLLTLLKLKLSNTKQLRYFTKSISQMTAMRCNVFSFPALYYCCNIFLFLYFSKLLICSFLFLYSYCYWRIWNQSMDIFFLLFRHLKWNLAPVPRISVKVSQIAWDWSQQKDLVCLWRLLTKSSASQKLIFSLILSVIWRIGSEKQDLLKMVSLRRSVFKSFEILSFNDQLFTNS